MYNAKKHFTTKLWLIREKRCQIEQHPYVNQCRLRADKTEVDPNVNLRQIKIHGNPLLTSDEMEIL